MEALQYVEDPNAWPTMVTLVGCLEAELERSGLPGLCVASVVPGPLAVVERCGQCEGPDGCGGQGWVRWVTEFPSVNFPEPDGSGNNCNAPIAYTLEVGISRCVSVGTSDGIGGIQGPTTEELVLATRQQMADKAAVKRAIACCVNDLEVSYFIGVAIPMQATGDCLGTVTNVTIWTQ